ncbi:Hypothetical_protein [Hexamita inflata]|uniref:Hypothetical_protein n=1 Tax=Hexamita inflata TaxID=28002 RepID=A0AA86URH5_9EUKA|nr:Hypothetical protein HINF_LOCUS35373 [Hexamita inflata]
MNNDLVLEILMKHSIDYSSFVQTNTMSNDQILVALMKCSLDYSSFVQSNNMSAQILQTQLRSPIFHSKKSNSSFQSKKEINSALNKREIVGQFNSRIVQFINNKHNEIAIELAFKEVLLQQEKNVNKNTAEQIQELKTRIQDLQRINAEQKIEYEQKISECQQKYDAELIKCRNEVEAQKKEYQQDFKKEYEKYKTEIEQLKQIIEFEQQSQNKINKIQAKKCVSDQEIDMNDTLANQLREECGLLQSQQMKNKLMKMNNQ